MKEGRKEGGTHPLQDDHAVDDGRPAGGGQRPSFRMSRRLPLGKEKRKEGRKDGRKDIKD